MKELRRSETRSKMSSVTLETGTNAEGRDSLASTPYERIKNVNVFLEVIKEGRVGEDTLDWMQKLRKPSVINQPMYPALTLS